MFCVLFNVKIIVCRVGIFCIISEIICKFSGEFKYLIVICCDFRRWNGNFFDRVDDNWRKF